MVFDRWETIRVNLNKKESYESISIDYDFKKSIPLDMDDFNKMYTSDEWNHHIYSLILQDYSFVDLIKKKNKTNFSFRDNKEKKRKLQYFIKFTVYNLYLNLIKLFRAQSSPLFINTYLNLFNLFKLCFRFKQFPIIANMVKPKFGNVNMKAREWIVEGKCNNDFETFLRNIIPKQIPISYLENYKSILNQANKTKWPNKPKLIFTSNNHESDDIFKIYAAEKVFNGSKLIIGQHGGNYGTAKFNFAEDHEIKISDYFFSWGWDDNNTKIKKVGFLKQLKYKPTSEKNKNVFLVTATVPRYSYWIYSIIISSQWESYLKDQFTFVEKLDKKIQNHLKVRLHPKDYDWFQFERWSKKFPKIDIDKGKNPIINELSSCKIFISTYNATTFLESIVSNIPTIIYWNPYYWELRNSAIPYFEKLREVGIFHESPESAANFLNKIWNDIDSWWNSSEVKNALVLFKKQYCDDSGNIVDKIEFSLRQIMQEKIYENYKV